MALLRKLLMIVGILVAYLVYLAIDYPLSLVASIGGPAEPSIWQIIYAYSLLSIILCPILFAGPVQFIDELITSQNWVNKPRRDRYLYIVVFLIVLTVIIEFLIPYILKDTYIWNVFFQVH